MGLAADYVVAIIVRAVLAKPISQELLLVVAGKVDCFRNPNKGRRRMVEMQLELAALLAVQRQDRQAGR